MNLIICKNNIAIVNNPLMINTLEDCLFTIRRGYDIMSDILEKIDEEIETRELCEKIGFENLPAGWTRKSVQKFAKTLADEEATEKGFFDKCVTKMSPHMDNPEGFCASVKDAVWGTTKWRGKDKKKEDIPTSRKLKDLPKDKEAKK